MSTLQSTPSLDYNLVNSYIRLLLKILISTIILGPRVALCHSILCVCL